MVFGVIPFVKLQLGYKTTLKQQLNGQKQKWSEKLNHVSILVELLFSCPVLVQSTVQVNNTAQAKTDTFLLNKHGAGKQPSSSKNR